MDFIAELQISSERRSWRGDEVVQMTASALHPVPDSEPGYVTDFVRVEGNRQFELSAADWAVLHENWAAAGLPHPKPPMTEEQWLPYVLAFNQSASRSQWEFGILPAVDPHRTVRLCRAAAQEEHASILKEAIAKGTVVAINPLTGARADPLSRLEAVALRRDGLAQFCTEVSIRLVQVEPEAEPELPRFAIPVRPLDVPSALLALQPDQLVRYDDGGSCGITGSGVKCAAELVDEFEGIIARQRLGAFLPDEMAHLVGEAQGFDSKDFRQRLEQAFKAGALIVRAPDTELPRNPSDPWRPHSDIITVTDLNAWLEGQGVRYRFPDSDRSVSGRLPASARGQFEEAGEGAPEAAKAAPRMAGPAAARNVLAEPGRPRAGWRRALEELLPKLEDQMGRQAEVGEVLRFLKLNGEPYGVEPGGRIDELKVRTIGTGSSVSRSSKTVSNALAALRKRSAGHD